MVFEALIYGFRREGRGQGTEGTEDFKLFTRTYMRTTLKVVLRLLKYPYGRKLIQAMLIVGTNRP